MDFAIAFVALLMLGIAIRMALRLVYAPRGPSARDAVYLVLNVTGWALIILGTMALLLFVTGVGGMPYGILFALVLAVVATMVSAQHLATQRRALLSLLAMAVEEDLPIEPTLAAFAGEYGGRTRAGAQRLTDLLSAGLSLPEAIHESRRTLPEMSAVYARVGHDIGALGRALREAVTMQSWGQSMRHWMAGRLCYLLLVLMFGSLIGLFALIKLVPAYEKIFQDFDMELPALTRAIIAVGNLLSTGLGMIVFLLPVGLLVIVGLLLAYEFRWLRSLPGLDRLLVRAHTAVVLRNLALATERQYPIPAALRSMAAVYPCRYVGRRLSRVAGDVDTGGDWCHSLVTHRLIGRADAAVLQAAQDAGNLPWALRETADRCVKRLGYRWQALVQLLFPWLVLCLGVLVMIFVVGMFAPLVELIGALT